MDHKSHEAMRAYLLGLLPDDQAAALEEEYFVNRAFFLKVQSEETALITDYLDGRLRGTEKQSFETRYLQVPNLRSRVEEVRKQRERPGVAPSSPWKVPRLAWAAAFILIFGLGALVYYLRPGERAKTSNQGQQVATNSSSQIPSSAGTDITVLLSPSITKGPGAVNKWLRQPAAEATVRLVLELPGESNRVQRTVEVLLVKADGSFATVWTSSNPIASVSYYGPRAGSKPAPAGTLTKGQPAQALTLSLPGSLFQPGDYLVKAKSTDGELHGTYAYRVIERK